MFALNPNQPIALGNQCHVRWTTHSLFLARYSSLERRQTYKCFSHFRELFLRERGHHVHNRLRKILCANLFDAFDEGFSQLWVILIQHSA